jgi:hypothetical protein
MAELTTRVENMEDVQNLPEQEKKSLARPRTTSAPRTARKSCSGSGCPVPPNRRPTGYGG